MIERDEDQDLLVFATDDDGETPAFKTKDEGDKWCLLIVDDDADVHIVTNAVLSDIRFNNKGLQINSCYSAAAACEFLDANPDVSVILLDVVMEADDAGLKVVRYVREFLGNKNVRIILRTGQPGQAPEQEVIVGYDINDYKSKAELTAQKLFTTVITALRSFSDIVALETNRNALRFISDTTATLVSISDPREFAAHALDTLLRFIGGDYGAGVARDASGLMDTTDLQTLALSGRSLDAEGAYLNRVKTIADQKASQYDDENTFLYFVTPQQRELVIHLSHARPLDPLILELLEHFVAKIGIAFDNITMQKWLGETNNWLETQVKARTEELLEKTMRLEMAQHQMAQELKLAHVLQQAILPTKLPCEGTVEVAAKMIPADQIGGDFYHLTQLDEHRIAIIIADVSGKGVAAAFFMLRAHYILLDILRRNTSTAECLTLANRQLCEANPLALFVTVFFGILDVKTSTLAYSSGGHIMPLLLKREGHAQRLPKTGGRALGRSEETKFTEQNLTLDRGDRLFLFTNGLTDVMDRQGECFGDDRLSASLVRHGALPIEASMNAIINDVTHFADGAPQSDDIACVLIGLNNATDAGEKS